jgi:hypothetical protein
MDMPDGCGPALLPVIERNVPIPDKKSYYTKEILSRLGIGDSVVLDRNKYGSCVWPAARKLGIKITRRNIDWDSIRVWRIA